MFVRSKQSFDLGSQNPSSRGATSGNDDATQSTDGLFLDRVVVPLRSTPCEDGRGQASPVVFARLSVYDITEGGLFHRFWMEINVNADKTFYLFLNYIV